MKVRDNMTKEELIQKAKEEYRLYRECFVNYLSQTWISDDGVMSELNTANKWKELSMKHYYECNWALHELYASKEVENE